MRKRRFSVDTSSTIAATVKTCALRYVVLSGMNVLGDLGVIHPLDHRVGRSLKMASYGYIYGAV